jgi:hypothetical protein
VEEGGGGIQESRVVVEIACLRLTRQYVTCKSELTLLEGCNVALAFSLLGTGQRPNLLSDTVGGWDITLKAGNLALSLLISDFGSLYPLLRGLRCRSSRDELIDMNSSMRVEYCRQSLWLVLVLPIG